MRFLVIHPGALGDTILSLPALRSLRERYPDSELTFAGNTDFAGAVVSGYAHRLLSLSGLPLNRLYRSEPLSHREAAFWQAYDRIISWTGFSSPEFRKNLKTVHPGALLAPWKPGPHETRHVSRIFVESLYPWIPVQKSISPAAVPVAPEARLLCEKWLDARGWLPGVRMAALHVGAGSREKRWPARHFRTLAARLSDLDLLQRILIVEGPAEPMSARSVAEELPATRVLVARDLSLNILAAILASCVVYVGSDSGLAHLAAVLGIPTVTLFGPTLPEHWAPLGKSVFVLRGRDGRVDQISPDEVLDAMKVIVPLNP